MDKTPVALRKHIVIVGKTNVGKSMLFNMLTGQNNAIVSPVPGTTTDPVQKAMELIPFGPVVLVDTAGLGDDSVLGDVRMKKTQMISRRADIALYAADAVMFDRVAYEKFANGRLLHLLVFTKWDLADEETKAELISQYPESIQTMPDQDVSVLHGRLSALLTLQQPEEPMLIADLVPTGGSVVLVTPIDSEAPKGRLILPQIQVLRECLDCGIIATVCREFELTEALRNQRNVDLVVTDSQVFDYVNKRLPPEIPLTSFSMLLARQKGNFEQLLSGISALDELTDGANILMLEGCTHNHTHEDIGRIKIPAMLRKKTGKKLVFQYFSGYDFPEDLMPFSMAILCGSCMVNRREIQFRLDAMALAGLSVTNYGIALAWGAGILERAIAVFRL